MASTLNIIEAAAIEASKRKIRNGESISIQRISIIVEYNKYNQRKRRMLRSHI
jgi:hypothetical protein